MNKNLILALAILAYCVWNAADLFLSWRTAPLEHFSWLLLLTWAFPILYEWIVKQSVAPGSALLIAAILATLLGSIASLNVVKDIGLALALGSFLPWRWGNLIWLASAFAWMPASGWLGSNLSAGSLFILRFAIVLFPAAWMVNTLRKYDNWNA